ncbi:MAG TPA: hypothetical protein VFK91_01880 [Methyloceanibacter sp.]|nr:hypothetical protein [Methyloceanibacter sp.]
MHDRFLLAVVHLGGGVGATVAARISIVFWLDCHTSGRKYRHVADTDQHGLTSR